MEKKFSQCIIILIFAKYSIHLVVEWVYATENSYHMRCDSTNLQIVLESQTLRSMYTYNGFPAIVLRVMQLSLFLVWNCHFPSFQIYYVNVTWRGNKIPRKCVKTL